MDRKKDTDKVWMSKDLIHFNLCGTDGYKARLEAIMEANERIQADVRKRTAGSNYKVFILLIHLYFYPFFRGQLLIYVDMLE